MSEYFIGSDGELYHWGVKGMKWGIRRYQNPDGSLTPAGKKRQMKKEKRDDDWKMLEGEAAVQNARRTRDALVEMAKRETNPAKSQLIKTYQIIADRELDMAKDNYARFAEQYINKYGRETYAKGIINTKHAQNGRGRVLQILGEDDDLLYKDFVSKFRKD